jgi:hypothetical protein
MNIWIIVIAIGRQFYLNVDEVEKKLTFRIRTFIIETIATTIVLTIYSTLRYGQSTYFKLPPCHLCALNHT